MRWLQALHAWLASELARYPRLVISGDYNIAPADSSGAVKRRVIEERCARQMRRNIFLRTNTSVKVGARILCSAGNSVWNR